MIWIFGLDWVSARTADIVGERRGGIGGDANRGSRVHDVHYQISYSCDSHSDSYYTFISRFHTSTYSPSLSLANG